MAHTAPIDILCFGGATLDRKYRSRAPIVLGTSNPTEAHVSAGGVARNVCETLARLGARVGLAALVGDDMAGRGLISELAALGVDTSAIRVVGKARTAEYVAVLDRDGSLAFGLADMAIHDRFVAADLAHIEPRMREARLVFADCNPSAAVLEQLIAAARGASWRLVIDPVSVSKAARLPEDLAGVSLLVLNADEARALTGVEDAGAAIRRLRIRGVDSVVLTAGAEPVLVAGSEGTVLVPVDRAVVADVTGAGDALIGATLAGLVAGRSLVDAVSAAVRVAALTVASTETVRADLTPALIEATARSVR